MIDPTAVFRTGAADPQQRNSGNHRFDLPLDWMVDNGSPMTTTQRITAPSDGGRGRVRVRHRRLPSTRWLLAATIIGALAIDQTSKEIALHALSTGSVTFGALHLHLVANRGILMGFPAPTAAIVIATIGVIIMAFRSARGPDVVTMLAYGLLAGGAMGNLVDRFQDRHLFLPGAVVDWISLGRITFNLADVFLLTGAITLLFFVRSDDTEPVAHRPE
ncbi:MAG: signal peptidase II [Actinomycetia bacterium]|nr:signal peptidase II [Actinomycetes bacterium]